MGIILKSGGYQNTQKRLITVGFQTEYGLIFLKNPIELNQCCFH
ncbi:Uncharacterized protein dnm_003610 [Desulfonema magnum]|uniref:Uncharacterized protein n=1 Tax=Desulfonema magnum TaxID=45655 RepID=A0A975BF60_9BACT|nr:Uncharacterized protein dnm_003610 [Desulfonema magnum]